jgi:hypothetical protein
MAKRAGARKSAKSAGAARSSAKRAGKPTVPRDPLARAAKVAKSLKAAEKAGRPSPDDLDRRNRLKSGPRRQAGPPLEGDTLDRAALRALRDEVVPKPTDPKKGRR